MPLPSYHLRVQIPGSREPEVILMKDGSKNLIIAGSGMMFELVFYVRYVQMGQRDARVVKRAGDRYDKRSSRKYVPNACEVATRLW